MVHQVKDLSPEQRVAVEHLLGRRVSEDESISIKAITSPAVIPSKLSHEERMAALRRLNEYFARVDVGRASMSEEEEDAIIDEALRSARPGYRPVV
jgi:hypothetical protein